MRASQLNEHVNTKNGLCPTPLKINKDSHFIKKSSSSPSSSSSSSSTSTSTMAAVKPQQQHRHPVIIYTHSPKIIHTNPRDFMALVQKLTGLSRSDDDAAAAAQQLQRKADKTDVPGDHPKKVKDDVESSSVITDDNRCRGSAPNIVGDGNPPCFLPTIYENNPPFLGNLPFFPSNSNDFLGQSYYTFPDSMIFAPTLSTSVSTFDGLTEFRDF